MCARCTYATVTKVILTTCLHSNWLFILWVCTIIYTQNQIKKSTDEKTGECQMYHMQEALISTTLSIILIVFPFFFVLFVFSSITFSFLFSPPVIYTQNLMEKEIQLCSDWRCIWPYGIIFFLSVQRYVITKAAKIKLAYEYFLP